MSTSMVSTATSCNAAMIFSGVSGGLAVVFGALGSHAFLSSMDPIQFKAYNIANQYHIVHSLAMLLTAAAAPRATNPEVGKRLWWAYGFFATGTVMVATSRYIHSTVHKPDFLTKTAALGAGLLLCGWVCVGAATVNV